ncbi:MAG: transposase [Elusimicrobia bacterium]|nr:transposase [Elusimicrobiota bacterium]
MGRPLRAQIAGACYYVRLAGNNRQDLFRANEDRRHFLALLRNRKERFELRIYAYCLLDPAIHLLLKTEKPNLSQFMQSLSTAYTKYFNHRHGVAGHLFQGRFQSRLLEPEEGLAEASRYIHLQPLKAGYREKPWRYPWSSCAAHFEGQAGETLVDTEPVLSRFAKIRIKQSVRYLQFLKDKMKAGQELGLPPSAPGTQSAPPGNPQERLIQAQRLLRELAAAQGIELSRLVGPLQWREIAALRRQAIHRVWKDAGLGVSELARLFNRSPGAISQCLRRFEAPDSRPMPVKKLK